MNKKKSRVNFDFFLKRVTLFRLESACDNKKRHIPSCMTSISSSFVCEEQTVKRCLPSVSSRSSSDFSMVKRRRRMVVEDAPLVVEPEPEISLEERENFHIFKQLAREDRPFEATSPEEALAHLARVFASDGITTDFGLEEPEDEDPKRKPTRRRTATRICYRRFEWQSELESPVALKLESFFLTRGGMEGLVTDVCGPVNSMCFCGEPVKRHKTVGLCLRHAHQFMRMRNKFVDLLSTQQQETAFEEWLSEKT